MGKVYEYFLGEQAKTYDALSERARALYKDVWECRGVRVHVAWLAFDTHYKELCDTSLVVVSNPIVSDPKWVKIWCWDDVDKE